MNNKPFYVVASIMTLALAAAILYYTSRPSSSDLASANESTTTWMCDGCGATVNLSEKQVADAQADPSRSTSGRFEGTPATFPILLCEKCKQMAVMRAEECPLHGGTNLFRHIDGSPAGCPQCRKEAKLDRR